MDITTLIYMMTHLPKEPPCLKERNLSFPLKNKCLERAVIRDRRAALAKQAQIKE